VGTHREIGAAIEKRFGGLSDSIAISFPDGTPAGVVREVVQDIHRVPSAFKGFPTAW
jgi:hypothetical protein